MKSQSKTSPCDYDVNPNRFRTNVEATSRYSQGDVHEEVAESLADAKVTRVLDLGCGEGRLVHPLRQRNIAVVAFDYSVTMLTSLGGKRVRGDAIALPFRATSFDAIASLYMLYHLAKPEDALRESHRVLRKGGIFIACAPSRYNDPELSAVLPYGEAETFDAENGVELVAEQFEVVAVQRWDAPLVHLPDQAALKLYLVGRGLATTDVDRAAEKIQKPLALTKRGMLLFAKKI